MWLELEVKTCEKRSYPVQNRIRFFSTSEVGTLCFRVCLCGLAHNRAEAGAGLRMGNIAPRSCHVSRVAGAPQTCCFVNHGLREDRVVSARLCACYIRSGEARSVDDRSHDWCSSKKHGGM